MPKRFERARGVERRGRRSDNDLRETAKRRPATAIFAAWALSVHSCLVSCGPITSLLIYVFLPCPTLAHDAITLCKPTGHRAYALIPRRAGLCHYSNHAHISLHRQTRTAASAPDHWCERLSGVSVCESWHDMPRPCPYYVSLKLTEVRLTLRPWDPCYISTIAAAPDPRRAWGPCQRHKKLLTRSTSHSSPSCPTNSNTGTRGRFDVLQTQLLKTFKGEFVVVDYFSTVFRRLF